MATAELAVALPALVLVLAVALAAVDLGVAQVRCLDAARTAARLLARGEPGPAAHEAALAAAPPGAHVAWTAGEGQVTVMVRASVPALLRPLGGLGTPQARAVARLEAPP